MRVLLSVAGRWPFNGLTANRLVSGGCIPRGVSTFAADSLSYIVFVALRIVCQVSPLSFRLCTNFRISIVLCQGAAILDVSLVCKWIRLKVGLI